MQALTDMGIAGALIFCLLSHTRGGLAKTNHLLWRLMMIALETGMVTTIVAIAALVASVAAPKTFIGIAIALPLPHIYGLSMV